MANRNLALPKLLLNIFTAPIAEDRNADMLLVADRGMQIRADFEAVDGNFIGDGLEIDGVEDMAVVEAIVLSRRGSGRGWGNNMVFFGERSRRDLLVG
jgi:hypothetical protein